MGVKSVLRLGEAQQLFPYVGVETLEPTEKGILDTTYLAYCKTERCVIKKYESIGEDQIVFVHRLLGFLKHRGLNVPCYLDRSGEWFRFTALRGQYICRPTLAQVGALGRFLGKMHRYTRGLEAPSRALSPITVRERLQEVRKINSVLAGRFERLYHADHLCQGVIHGDLFRDNVLFQNNSIGVLDFTGSGCGSFAFDAGVCAANWCITSGLPDRGRMMFFLRCYNRYTSAKLTFLQLLNAMQNAAVYYAIQHYVLKRNGECAVPDYHVQLNRARQISRLLSRNRHRKFV